MKGIQVFAFNFKKGYAVTLYIKRGACVTFFKTLNTSV